MLNLKLLGLKKDKSEKVEKVKKVEKKSSSWIKKKEVKENKKKLKEKIKESKSWITKKSKDKVKDIKEKLKKHKSLAQLPKAELYFAISIDQSENEEAINTFMGILILIKRLKIQKDLNLKIMFSILIMMGLLF